MFSHKSNPTLYQINARPWVDRLTRELGRQATLDDIPSCELDELSERGFQWLYLLGVWQTGDYGRQAARIEAGLYNEYRLVLPDVTEDDICGSPFAVQAYHLNKRLGDETALAHFRERLHRRGIRLMLDFVPNHTAVDHPWAYHHPDYYIPGKPEDLEHQPHNYIRLDTIVGEQIFAHGRDPYFPAWRDTLQLNYSNPSLQAAMAEQILAVASRCDGLRCDMAMLLLPGVIERVWKLHAQPFWPVAIEQVRQVFPEFVFMAEVYWGLEWTLQQDGFHFTYDKTLYDRIRDLQPRPVRDHLLADLSYQNKMVRFLENHDEKRAASILPDRIHPAAAILAYLNPGLRFFHHGQLSGSREHIPVQLCRAPVEEVNPEIELFYTRLLNCLKLPVLHSGAWQLLDPLPDQIGDQSWQDILAWIWKGPGVAPVLVVVNYSPRPGACCLRVNLSSKSETNWKIQDLFSELQLESTEEVLKKPGISLTLSPWGFHVFQLTQVAQVVQTGSNKI